MRLPVEPVRDASSGVPVAVGRLAVIGSLLGEPRLATIGDLGLPARDVYDSSDPSLCR
jgi:hypothetical protein